MNSRAPWMILSLVAAGLPAVPAPAIAQHQAPPTAAALVRCRTGLDAPCIQARVTLDTTGGALLSGLDSAAEAGAWIGWMGATRLVGPGVTVPAQVRPPLRLLVLLDRSGSMQGSGMAFTRITLRQFIQALDSTSIRVAVAGFESRDVARGIESAEFVAPARAADIVDAMQPDPAGNTALYAALLDGITRVNGAIAAEPGVRGAILLVTDGRNDVGHPRDDPGLASGPDGLAEASAAAERSGLRIWLLGVGSAPAQDELRTLAGAHGAALIASLDPNALADKLRGVSRELHDARALTFGMPGRVAFSLGRSAWLGAAAVQLGGRTALLQPLVWQPPVFALPAFTGVADSAALPAALNAALAAGDAGSDFHWLMAVLFGVAGLAGWVLIPRFFWRQEGVAPAQRLRARGWAES